MVEAKRSHKKAFSVVSLTDLHYPFQDTRAISAALEYVRKTQPSVVVCHELHDFYTLSHFDKDPRRKIDLQDEIDQVAGFFKDLREACPDSRIIMLDSNHLDRLRRYLWSQAQALCSLRALEIPELLNLAKYNIEYLNDVTIRGVLFKHGEVVRQGSGASALAELQKENISGISGHTHRIGIVYRRDREGLKFWIESGCLCITRPDYIKGIPNWQSGFAEVSWREGSNMPRPELIRIVDGACVL